MNQSDEQGSSASQGPSVLDMWNKLLKEFSITQYEPLSEPVIVVEYPDLCAEELLQPLEALRAAAVKYTGNDDGFSINGPIVTPAINIPLEKVKAIFAMPEVKACAATLEMFKPLTRLAVLNAAAKDNEAFMEDLVRSTPPRLKGDFYVSRTTYLMEVSKDYLRIHEPHAPIYVLRTLTAQGDRRNKRSGNSGVPTPAPLTEKLGYATHPLNNLAEILNEAAGEPLFHSTVGYLLRVTITEANVEKLREKSPEVIAKVREILLEPEAACQARGGWRVAAHKLLRQPPTRPPEDNPLPPESISQPQQEEFADFGVGIPGTQQLTDFVGKLNSNRSISQKRSR